MDTNQAKAAYERNPSNWMIISYVEADNEAEPPVTEELVAKNIRTGKDFTGTMAAFNALLKATAAIPLNLNDDRPLTVSVSGTNYTGVESQSVLVAGIGTLVFKQGLLVSFTAA